MTPKRPSFADTLETLRRFAVADEEHDLRATVEYVFESHQSEADAPDDAGDRFSTWGVCEGCDQRWPCPTWTETEAACTEWMIRRSSEAVAAARKHLEKSKKHRRSA